MRRVTTILLSALLLLSAVAVARNDAGYWSLQAVDLGNDYFIRSLLPLPSDRLALAGDWLRVPPSVDGASIPINNLFVQLHGPDGSVDWTLTVPGSGNTEFAQLAQDPDSGDLFAVGRSWPSEGVTDVFVVRISEQGELIWEREFREPGTQQASSVAVIPGDGLVLAGMTIPLTDGPGNPEGLILRLDADGNELWRYQTSSLDHTSFSAVAVHADGAVSVAGVAYSDFAGRNAGLSDVLLMTFDAEGGLLWQTQFGGEGEDSPVRMAVTDDSDLIVVGHTFSAESAQDVFLARYSATGEQVSLQTFGGNDSDRALALRLAGETVFVAAVMARYEGADGPVVKSVSLNVLVDGRVLPAVPEVSFDGAIGGAVILVNDAGLASLLLSVNSGPGWRLMSVPAPAGVPELAPPAATSN